jgi:CheY-like chemotaxis protein
LVGEIANREFLEQSAFDRDKFLAILSQEMQQPLGDILSYSRILMESKPKSGTVENIQNIQYSANNLLVLVNDMLDYSNIEAGKIVLDSVEFEPHKTIAELQKQYNPVFNNKAVSFSIDLDSHIPARITGDPVRFKQILNNILSNAAYHAGKGDVKMRLTAGETQGDFINLNVNLNAVGSIIEQVELDALQHSNYHTAENTITDKGSQAFSLALAKRLVGLQNGRFEAENFGEEGSTYSVVLPFRKHLKKSISGVENARKYESIDGKYILIAEDNKINQLVVTKMLQKAGAIVVPTDDGLAALDAFNAGYFDLILMDIQMPKLDGYRTVAAMRSSEDPRKKETPIIALTASAYLTDKDKAQLFQMNDHIGKPFSPDEMMEKVAECLRSNS